MGQVEDPSYIIRVGAAGERSAEAPPASAHQTTRKGYETASDLSPSSGGWEAIYL